MVTQIAGVIEKYQRWAVVILVIAFLYTVVSKVNYIELILTRRKRILDRLRESVSDLNTEKPVSARLALQEIHRLERIDLYGTHFYNVQNELEKISDFHSFTISDVKFMAEFSRFLKWTGSKIHFGNLDLWVMRGFASAMIVAGVFFLLVSGVLAADGKNISYTVYYGIVGLVFFLMGCVGMPPLCTKTKKAKKYISDYYNSIEKNLIGGIMPITLKDIRDHQEMFDIGDISRMDIEEYKQMLSREAYFWMDHHEALRHQLSGEIIAYYPEQVDALIEQLKSYKQIMHEAGKGDFD